MTYAQAVRLSRATRHQYTSDDPLLCPMCLTKGMSVRLMCCIPGLNEADEGVQLMWACPVKHCAYHTHRDLSQQWPDMHYFLENFDALVAQYRGDWIAIVANEVVAHAKTPAELRDSLKAKGIGRTFITRAAPEAWGV